MAAMNYQNLIDAATWGFIRRTDAFYPADTASLTIADQRRIYDTMCRAFFRGYPEAVSAQNQFIAGVPCRVYPGAQPTVIYLHGGGFVVGGLDSHDDVCAELRQTTGLMVIAVDYRLSPEHLHPAAFDDALAVTRAVAGPVVLVGDSAGGNLAAAVSRTLRATPPNPILPNPILPSPVLGQVLIYPGLGGDENAGSYLTHANAPMLTRADVLFYSGIRHPGPKPVGDATAAPLQDSDFSGLPPTVAFSAECDPLSDDARDYAAQLNQAGGRAHWVLERGLVHGYLRARTTVPRAARSFARITAAIATLARGDWPYEERT